MTQAATRTVELELGAPSLADGGDDAPESAAAADFAGAKYPLTVEVKNHMPRDVAFPEVEGLFLRHAGNPTQSRATVTVTSYDLLQRLVSSVEQVAELNGYEKALTLLAVIPGEQAASEASTRAGADEAASATARGSRKGRGVSATTDAQPGASADAVTTTTTA